MTPTHPTSGLLSLLGDDLLVPAGLLAVVGYVCIFVAGLSDADLINPGTRLDLAFIKTALNVPAGSALTPLLQIPIPLAYVYLFTAPLILLIHFYLLSSVVNGELTNVSWIRTLAFWLPLFAIALISWKFLPFGRMQPAPRGLATTRQLYTALHSLVLVLDFAMLASVKICMFHYTKPTLGIISLPWSLVVLASTSFGLLALSISAEAPPLSAASCAVLGALFVLGVTCLIWMCIITLKFVTKPNRDTTNTQTVTTESMMTALTILATAAGTIAIVFLNVGSRALDLSGVTLMRVEPGDMTIATIAAGIYSASGRNQTSIDPRFIANAKQIDAIGKAKQAATLGLAKGVNLTRYRLDGARFVGGRFDLIRLDGAMLDHADFTGASLVGASFEHSCLKGARFTESDLTGAKIRPVLDVRDETCRLPPNRVFAQDSNVSGGLKIPPISENKSISSSAESSENAFKSAKAFCDNLNKPDSQPPNSIDFSGVILQDTDFTGADLKCAKFDDVILNATNKFTNADLRLATLRRISTTGAPAGVSDLGNAKLQGADFTEAVLPNFNFSNANVFKAKFVNASLQGAIFAGAELSKADFCGANLEGVDFTQADFGPGGKAGEDVTCPQFNHANLQTAKFCKVQLLNCEFSHVAWRQIKLLNFDDPECMKANAFARVSEADHPEIEKRVIGLKAQSAAQDEISWTPRQCVE